MTPHKWEIIYPKARSLYMSLVGHTNAIVRVSKMPNGFLWQYKKHSAYAETIEAAMEWVETFAEAYDIPPDKRWLNLSYLKSSN